MLVQRWRQDGLLGQWEHIHAGPGSTAVAPIGSYERARLLARLGPKDRTLSNVVLLGLLTGVSCISAAEISDALQLLFRPSKILMANAPGAEPRDRAEAVVDDLLTSRRQRATVRRLATRLADTPVLHRTFENDPIPTTAKRVEAVVTALLAATDGDASWVGVLAADSLRLGGMGGVVDAANLDDFAAVSDIGIAMETPTAEMVAALETVDQLTSADIETIQTVLVMFVEAGGTDLTDFSNSVTPIVDPDQLVGMSAAVVLSQAAMPDTVLKQLLYAKAEHQPSEPNRR